MAQTSLRSCALHVALGIGLCLVTHPLSIAQVAGGALHDPDSYMRLVRIRDGLLHGGFASVVQADAGGQGTDTGWSHLVDAAILALRWLLYPALGDAAALRWAGAVIGPLSVGLLAAAACWAIAPLCSGAWLWTAALAAPVAPVVAAYGAPGCAHHHVPLVCTVVMLAGWTGRALGGGARAGGHAGVWAGLGIWLSPEVTPFVLLAFGALGLGWARHRGAAVRPAAMAFLAVILGAWVVDPPLAGYRAAQVDRLSLVSVALALLLAAVALWLGGVDRMRLAARARGAAGLLGATAAAMVWAALFPALLRGPTGMLTPDQARAFFGIIAEMQPALDGAGDALAACLGALVAAAVAADLALRQRSWAWAWAYAGLCVAGAAALGLLHGRFAIYGQVAGAMALPVALTRISAATARSAPGTGVAARLAVMGTVLLLPMLLQAGPASAAPHGAERCRVRPMLPVLARYPGAVVLDDIDDTPELLYRTTLRPVGSFYHRGIAAFMAARAAWRSGVAMTPPDAVRATGATLILTCRGGRVTRDPLVADMPGQTLSDQLRAGEVPPWLQPVATEPDGGYRLFRIMPPGAAYR